MTFARPEFLVLPVLLPALMAGLLFLYVRRRRRVAGALGDATLVRRLVGVDLHAVPWRRVAALLGATAALGLAAAGPRWGVDDDPESRSTHKVVLVLDASNSMLVGDAAGGGAGQPQSRLDVQTAAARRLIRELEGSRIGLVIFAGRAYVLSPLTRDQGALELFVDALGPEIVEQTGTSLASAIRQGTNLLALSDSAEAAGTLVLFSDGDALEERSQVLAAAQRAERAGVPVYTVGIGAAQGGPVPDLDYETGEHRGFKVDPITGRTAVSRANEALLREIAAVSGGRHVAPATADAVSRLVRALEAAPGERGATSDEGTAGARYGWFLGLALFLLAVDAAQDARPLAER